MSALPAIEALAGIALMGLGLHDMLEGRQTMDQSRGWFRASARENLILGLISLLVGAALVLDAIGFIAF